jgi:hypothetical protein
MLGNSSVVVMSCAPAGRLPATSVSSWLLPVWICRKLALPLKSVLTLWR